MQHSKSYKITSKQKPISVRATLDTVVCGVTPYHLPNCTPNIGSTTPPVTSTPALAAARIFNFSFNAASLGHVATGTDCRTRFLLLGAKINGPLGKSAATEGGPTKKSVREESSNFRGTGHSWVIPCWAPSQELPGPGPLFAVSSPSGIHWLLIY